MVAQIVHFEQNMLIYKSTISNVNMSHVYSQLYTLDKNLNSILLNTLQVPSQWCQLQAIITTNSTNLDPVMFRLKSSPYKELNDKEQWFYYDTRGVITQIDPAGKAVDPSKEVIHKHIYINESVSKVRQTMFEVSLHLFSQLEAHYVRTSKGQDVYR